MPTIAGALDLGATLADLEGATAAATAAVEALRAGAGKEE